MKRFAIVLTLVVALGAAAPAAPTDFTVTQKNKEFSDKEMRVAAGDTLVFQNQDDVTHNVYSITKGLEFELKTQAPGTSGSVKFDRAGTVLIECAIHPKMKLRVHVGG